MDLGRKDRSKFIYAKISTKKLCYNLCKSTLKQIAKINANFICKTLCIKFTNICICGKLLQTERRLEWEKQWDMHELAAESKI